MGGFSFLHPYFLGLLLLIPLLAYWHSKKQLTQKATLRVSSVSGISKKNTWRTRLYKNMYWLPLVALALLSIALARPRSIDAQDVEGIDIVMAVDVSTSMMAADLQPNRLEALKKVAEKFVAERENDRIGLVVYAGEAFTRVPLTSDKIRIYVSSSGKWRNIISPTGISVFSEIFRAIVSLPGNPKIIFSIILL